MSAGDGTTLYVSVQGDDRWTGARPEPDGTADGPLATLERARDLLRETRRAGGLARGARVLLRGGTYLRQASFSLGPQDG
ncbi:MAG: right-handed parallel beta-helix repeat-containing protein, partial [Candidatus Latescibacterota bacterium]